MRKTSSVRELNIETPLYLISTKGDFLMRRSILRCAVAVALASIVFSQWANAQQKAFADELRKEWPLALPRGSTVVVKIPINLWRAETDQRKDLKIWTPFKDERGPSGTGLAYFVDVDDVLNHANWASGGFPLCGEFILTKAYELKSPVRHNKLPYTEIELQSGSVFLRLHFARSSSESNAINADFQKLTVPGNWSHFETSEDFQKNVFAPQDARLFAGPLSRLSYSAKLSLLHLACNGQNTFATETFKNKTY